MKACHITIQSHHRSRWRFDPHFRGIKLHSMSLINPTCVLESGFLTLHRCSRRHLRSCALVLGKYLSDLLNTSSRGVQRSAASQRFALVQQQRSLAGKHGRHDNGGSIGAKKRGRQRAQNCVQIRYSQRRNMGTRDGHISISSMRK